MKSMRYIIGLFLAFTLGLTSLAACTPEEVAQVVSLLPQAIEVPTSTSEPSQSTTEASQGTVEAPTITEINGPATVEPSAQAISLENDIDPIAEYQFVVDAIRYHHPNPKVDRHYWIWRQAGWTDEGDESWKKVSAIIECESGGSPTAVNPTLRTGTHGLFQIHRSSWFGSLKRQGILTEWSQIYDPYTNAAAALYIKRLSGWHNWECA